MEENVLVIKHGALGDFVLASGCMLTIRKLHPGARITLITEAFLKDLAESMGLFDEIVIDSRGYRFGDWHRVIKKTIADNKWDVIYDLQTSNRTLCRYYPLALFATRHAMRWGYITDGGLMFRTSTRKPPFVPWAWKSAFKPVAWLEKDLSMCHGSHAHFDELPGKYALLIPGCSAGNEHKRWPVERFVELTKHFASSGLKSVILGTKAEAETVESICANNPNTVNFLVKSSIADIPDLANQAEVVVANDTGPGHIAHIAGARVILLFIDRYFRAAPKNNPAVVSLHGKKIDDISVSEVIEAIGKVLRDDR